MYVLFQSGHAVFGYSYTFEDTVKRGMRFNSDIDATAIIDDPSLAQKGEMVCISLQAEVNGKSFTEFMRAVFLKTANSCRDMEELYSSVAQEGIYPCMIDEIVVGDVLIDDQNGRVMYHQVDMVDLNNWVGIPAVA